MVGTVADGQLTSMASAPPGTSVRFAVATRADDAAIRRLLRENPLRGAVTLTLEREPGYFQGTALAGGEDQTIVAFERDRLLCMGRCTIREAWLNGRAQRVAYLAELRLDAAAQGRVDILRGGYRFFHELQRASPADFTFTSIATDNTRARRFLERGLPGLPRYEFLGGLTTLLISTRPRRLFARPKQDVLETTTADELAEFFNRSASCYQLAPIWTPERILRLGTHGLAADSFGVVRTNGRIIAAGALWDQRSSDRNSRLFTIARVRATNRQHPRRPVRLLPAATRRQRAVACFSVSVRRVARRRLPVAQRCFGFLPARRREGHRLSDPWVALE
jgi:hypothetical protein